MQSRFVVPAALSACVFLLTGCVQPLGPGYRFTNRQADIHATAGAADRVHIRVADHLENAGSRALRSLEVQLPAAPNSGANNPRMTIDDKEVSSKDGASLLPHIAEASFDPPWEQNSSHDIVTEWDLAPGSGPNGAIAVWPESFYIADRAALPLWQAPVGAFSKGGSVPEQESLTVFTPEDFRVLAPGRPLKRAINGSQSVWSFKLRPDRDFLLYVVAGRYQEKVVGTQKQRVVFWTFGDLDAEGAEVAGARLASSKQAFVDFFGPLFGNSFQQKTALHIVETSNDLLSEFGAADVPGGLSFPEGVLLDSRAIAKSVANESVLELSEYELAQTWFGWGVPPAPEAQILMSRGVGLFGLVIAAEARGSEQRPRMISSLLKRYDEARAIAIDKRLIAPPDEYSQQERISTGYRGALFLVALEDLCGHDRLSAAFQQVVHARAGSEVGYEELRAALESTCGRDLAEMFRTWLIRPGVPDDLRARYAGSSASSAALR